MSEQEKKDSQKTVVAFVAGLLIGGLLVWIFGGTPETTPAEDTNETDTTTKETDTNDEEEADEADTATNTDTDEDVEIDTTPVTELPTGTGEIEVEDQTAGTQVTLAGATFPSDEGWIGVRDYVDGQLTGLLGVVRYSKEQGLVPQTITLQRATVAGNTYAVVFYSDNGDRTFSLANDAQIEGVMETFVAK